MTDATPAAVSQGALPERIQRTRIIEAALIAGATAVVVAVVNVGETATRGYFDRSSSQQTFETASHTRDLALKALVRLETSGPPNAIQGVNAEIAKANAKMGDEDYEAAYAGYWAAIHIADLYMGGPPGS